MNFDEFEKDNEFFNNTEEIDFEHDYEVSEEDVYYEDDYSLSSDYEDVNDASLVLYLTDGTFRALMMGDGAKAAEEAVFKRGIKDVTLLKVAHHGSAKGSNSEAFLQSVSAQIAVISCAKNNSYGHPHNETLQYLEHSETDVYRTDLQGAIRILIEHDGVRVIPYRIP